ncbi:MAG: DUF4397 domain-containing protein [Chitinophagaceae bacterium]|nr:DUF4397 domain-containing protein [Chitinophagaceae bacterium]
MKKSLQHIFFGSLVLVIGLVACNKDTTYIADPVTLSSSAYIKFLHVSPSLATITGQADNVTLLNLDLKSNTYSKLTGTPLAYERYFPTTTNVYAAVTAGLKTIKFSLAAISQKDSLELFLKQVQADAGKYYSFIITDSIKSASLSKAMFLQDDILTLGSTQIGMRFVHAIWNDTAAKNVDIFSIRNNATIFSARGAGSASTFTPLNYFTTSDTLIVRRAGTTFALASLNGVGFTPGRNYTLVYKGNGAVTTATAKPRSLLIYGH